MKIAKRNMRQTEKNKRDKTIKLKHNEFRRLRQLKWELGTQAKAVDNKNKLTECGNDSTFY